MLTKTSQYALRAVVLIAEAGDRRVPAQDVAAALDVPPNYLSKILYALARAAILDSERGPRGGYALARPAAAITLDQVVAPFEAIDLRGFCLLRRRRCSAGSPCSVHNRWKDVAEPMREFFAQTTIADVAERAAPAGATPTPGGHNGFHA